ncbi:MAG: GNAT family N-acetyltransferase [Ghiorsea sp.]|nr:GNAT family N-acetyltransferase [Ghiorsea sp.]
MIQNKNIKLARYGIRIRDANTEDLSKLTVLVSELFNIEPDFNPNIRKQRQGLAYLMECEQATVLLMESSHEIIAMCTLQPLISTAEGGTVGMVEDLIVAEKWRGKGLGTVLLNAVQAVALTQGMSRLQLLAGRGNAQAQLFFDKQEWQKTNMRVRRKNLEL